MNDYYRLVEPLPELIIICDYRWLSYIGDPIAGSGKLNPEIEEWCEESLQASWKFYYNGYYCYRLTPRTGYCNPKPIIVTAAVIEFSTIADKILFVLRWCGDN